MSNRTPKELRDRMARLVDEELMAQAKARLQGAAEPAAPATGRSALQEDVHAIAARALRIPEERLDPTENLASYGIDSIAITEVMVQLSRHFGISVAPTTFFEAKNLDDLARILDQRYGKAIDDHYRAKAAPAPVAVAAAPAPMEPAPAAGPDVNAWLSRHRARQATPASASTAPMPASTPERDTAPETGSAPTPRISAGAGHAAAPIAVISMEGRFPRSPDLDTFAARLRAGEDCIDEVPPERWDWRGVWGDPKQGPYSDVKYGGFVADHDKFDAAFFGISPKEAELMDPQHRLFMECVWQLIESAGYAPGSLAGKKVGLFLGINLLDYTDMANRAGLMEALQMTGLGHAFCPNRLSFLLDIHGPSQVIDTACSSSLVAVHRAVMSIRHEGCEMAIAGGANLMLTPLQHLLYSKIGMLCPDGRCKSFSAAANGYARADGVGAVLLKRLDLAERDGDNILGVILGSAERHGGGATSLTAPNPQSQARLIVEAHRQAGVDPRSVSLIECHGTGTPLGDPVEVEGLKAAFAELYRERQLDLPAQPHCGLGSVKSNIGHAETAAGVSGLIKVLLAMGEGIQYRSLHCEQPNPLLGLEGSPFHLLQQARPWARPRVDGVEQPRRAGVSSFGAGGASAHLVLEEYRPRQAPAPAPAAPGPYVFPLSAKTEAALRQMAERLRPWLASAPLADIAYTLQLGRDAMRVRAAFVAESTADLDRQLAAFAAGGNEGVAFGSLERGRRETPAPLDPTTLSPAELAARWVAGAPVDWARGAQGRRRVRLPAYPFQRKRFWLPVEEAAAPGLKLIEAGPDRFLVELSGKEFFLDHHRIQGQPVLPGVAYLELARLAAERAGLGPVALGQVVWLRPMTVSAPLTAEITLIRDGGALPRVEIHSLDAAGERRLHAQLRLLPAAVPAGDEGNRGGGAAPTEEGGVGYPPDAMLAAFPRRYSADHIYGLFDAMGLHYGPGHRAIESLWRGGEPGRPEVLARLRLPQAANGSFQLHPSLMDGAFQAGIGMALDDAGQASEGASLPFALARVEIHGPCTPQMWVRIRAAGPAVDKVRTLQLELLDAEGRLRVRMDGFATRALEPKASSAQVLLFAPHWRAADGAVDPALFKSRLALLADLALSPEALGQRLPAWQCRALTAARENDPARRFHAQAQALLGELQRLPAASAAAPALVQLVLEEGADSALAAGLAGMLRTARQELPGLWCQLITVPAGLDAAALAAQLERAAGLPQHGRLRLVDGALEAEGWRELTAGAGSAPWRDGGVYLISGGAGGLGRRLAQEILHWAPTARVVLAGRSARSEAWPAGIEYRQADFSEAAAVAELVADIRRRHGRLDGVVHAAGVTRDAALARKTPEQLAEVLAAKLDGALHLDAALGNEPLEFFVLFASIAGALGNPGQADYAAANAALEGFAQAREARRRAGERQGRTLAVAWPLWREGGMGVDAATEALMGRTTGLTTLETAAGLQALYGALATDAPRVLVVTGDAERLRKRLLAPVEPPRAPAPAAPAAAVDSGLLRERVLETVARLVCQQLKVEREDLAPDIELAEYGFDSISFTQFANALNERFRLELTPTLFFEHPTLDALASHLAQAHAEAMAAALGVTPAAAPRQPESVAAPLPAAPVAAPLPRPAEPMPAEPLDDAVAIIGMSGVFPQAPDVETFWRNLLEGRDCIGEIPPERWDWRAYWGDPAREPGRTQVKWGGFMDGIGEFDAGFFGISAPEARMMDPQQRLLLTQAWRVMEDAGYAPRRLSGSRTGVFVGIADAGYGRLLSQAGTALEGYTMTGLAPSLGPNRISFHFNLQGPSVAVETACSSALVAIHRAVEAIRQGGCDAAIAGGINTLLLPDTFIGFSKAGMLSPDGRSKPFSAAANGYARGEGVGLVFLKRLADARRDGDRILAVIRASAENHGGRASSLTAPNPKAQAELLRGVYARAGFDPRSVSYIETHGTGTPLGDPIEVEALTTAFADLDAQAEARFGPAPAAACGIGSVKSNIGHLELAAGAAGLIKILLQLRHGQLVKTLHCDQLNPYLKLGGSRFQVVRENRAWDRPVDAAGRALPRRAGVSSFGFGGSNAHLVVEEYPEAPVAPEVVPEGPAMIVLSAKTPEQLMESARRLLEAVEAGASEARYLASLACTLQTGRDPMEHRLAFTATDLSQVRARLAAFVEGRDDPAVHQGRVKPNRDTMAVLESDPELCRGLADWPARGRHDALLQLWVRGLSFDWQALYAQGRPPRLSLPGYPFARTVFWPQATAAVAPSAPENRPEPGRLLAGSEFFLRDHQVGGMPVLPGVMHLELLRQALGEGTALTLADHVWLRPVVVDAPLPIKVELTREPDGSRRYQLVSAGNVVHSQGRVLATHPGDAPRLDLQCLAAAAPRLLEVDALYRRFAAMGLDYGPAHRALREVRLGEGLVLARLERPAGLDDAGLALHPSLLDGALQALLGFAGDAEPAPALPYGLKGVRVYGPTEPVMVAVARPEAGGHRIELCDEQGTVRVVLEGFVSRPLAAPARSAAPLPVAPAQATTHLAQVAAQAEATAPDDRLERALAALVDIAARVLEVDPSVLETDTELGEFGFDSITMTGFAAKVNAELSLSLTPADFFEFATLDRLAAHIAGELPLAAAPVLVEPAPAVAPAVVSTLPAAAPAVAVEEPLPLAQPAPLAAPPADDDPIAIVGISCRFPMALDPDGFWDNLLAGRDCISRIPPERWDWRAVDGDPKQQPNKTNIHWAGFIDGVFEFDPLFFGISPREAKLMDPQQRLMLMHAWKALEDAGHAPRSLAGRAVGLWVATSSSGYREVIGEDTGGEGYVATGAVPSVGPNRISYFLDWHGPSEPVETACSSALVALHRAVQAMDAGDCELALVGGVNTIVTPEAHINFAKAGMLSPDGRCKTFSAQANGYARGEGVGMIVLKRLSQAEADGDPIYGLIRGSAINHGGRANSLTAPNTAAQAALLRQAYRGAGVDPRTVGYIEAHGTGTALGDPVEVNALKSAFRALEAEQPPAVFQGSGCGLGSVKTNIGHLELAAGMAGVIKVLLQMRHRTLAASLHCEEPNPYIDFGGSPFRVIREAQPWAPVRDADGRELPRRAGVSSFGFGGVNAHVILEEYRPRQASDPATGPALVVLSARDEERLRDQVRQLIPAVARLQAHELHDLAYTLQLGREPMRQRLALVVDSLAELGVRLEAFLAGDAGAVSLGRVDPKQTAPDPGPAAGLEAVAAAWLAGAAIDWRRLHTGRRQRLRLPTYPFARDVYHIDRAFGARAQAAVAAPALAEPAQAGPFRQRLAAEDFFLRDHRVAGKPMLPGAMSLELARAAFAGSRGTPSPAFEPVVLSQVVWQQPLIVAQGALDVSVLLTPEPAGSAFRLMSGETVHARGLIAPLADAGAPTLDPALLALRCPTLLDVAELYRTYAGLGLDYGPSFRVLSELRLGSGELLARLVLPAQATGEFGIHPSLLDGAFHACLGLFSGAGGGGGAALPFALERMEVLAPTTERMWAHVREQPAAGAIRKLDIDLADDQGRLCLRVRAFSVRMPGGARAPEQSQDLQATAQAYLAQLLAAETGMPAAQIEPEAALEAYGIDSVMITRLTDLLEKRFGTLPRTLFFEYQTLAALAEYFAAHHGQALGAVSGASVAAARAPEPAVVHAPAPVPASDPSPATGPARGDGAIAIVGVAGRYPGARDLEAFWANLAAGRDCISEVPPERWDHSRYFDPVKGTAGKTNSKWGGFVDDFDRFDPLFFNVAPRDAEFMDPQERLFLQCAWETLEDAGHTRESLGRNVGVFVGVMYEEYQLYGAESTQAGKPLALGGSPASIANRVSYFCDFHGPSLAVDSMCSSSLTAIHLACEALRSGDCDAALAGGVNLTLHPNKYLALAQGRFMSSSGRCESFGQGGDGYVPGEGVGAVLLKRLDQALADGDRIHGVIRASALNHGGKTNGYTVPNPRAQSAVISRALARAQVTPRDISYIEAHGTGTSLGDPIEIGALTQAFRAHTGERGFCAIGSVKSNIGHCESAAGIAGLTKLLLQLRHGQLAPSLHSETLNPGIDFDASPFLVQRRLAPWPRGGGPRIAGLSSFGAGGSNAHLIIEEFIAPAAPAQAPELQLFPVSARDDQRLREALARLRAALDTVADQDLAGVARTLQEGREAFESRLALVAGSRQQLIQALDRVLAGDTAVAGVYRGQAPRSRPAPEAQALLAARDLHGLAALWAGGGAFDWRPLRQGRPLPPKLGLPSYPFARERYWAPAASAATAALAKPEATVALAHSAPLTHAAPAPLMLAPDWREQALAEAPAPEQDVLVLACELPESVLAGLESALAPARLQRLQAAGPIEARYSDYAAQILEQLQALFRARPQRALVQLLVPADGDGLLLEGLGGLLRSARLERAGLACQLIAVSANDPALAARLRAEWAGGDGEIRYRDGRRLRRGWRELTGPTTPAAPWKDGGVYLITGGAGGLGLLLSRQIAAGVRRPALWLTGRSELSAQVQEQLAGLAATVRYRRVDVTDAAQVQALVAEIRQEHGRLDGVVHAAGLVRDKLLVRKSAEELRAVLAPKVAGLVNLDAATAAEPLDFMLLFGSVSGALGNAGQCDYAAANAFMDAFAQARNQRCARGERHGRTLSLDWPYWRDGGMRLDQATLDAMERTVGVRPLETGPAMTALAAALALGESQVLVLDGDHARLRQALAPAAPQVRTATPPAPQAQAVPGAAAGARERILALVRDAFSQVLKIPAERLDPQEPFDRFGMDSVSAVQVLDKLQQALGPLPPTLLFEYPRLAALTDVLLASHGGALPAPAPVEASRAEPAPARPQDIAIIAVAGRYPGADTIEELWQALEQGRDLVTPVPAERWDHPALYSPHKGKPGSAHCNWGGFIADVDRFDAGFFGYTPREAALADPEQRLFLQTCWHLLERAGHTRPLLRERYQARVGVFVGAMYSQYRAYGAEGEERALLSLASYSSIANRVSFFLDLQGPSVAVDSMCSSGLQAVHQACQSLRLGECRLAIAGGVNLSVHPDKYLGLSRAGLIGSRADSRSFADGGDGYLPAEGVGAVLLKPLADALRDGDPILGVIRASAANHGGHSAGYAVPSAEAQARLIEDNLRASGVDPRTIGYVEAAANGSAMGDAIELRALTRAFRALGVADGACAIGSVKSNMGHAEAASGLAQLTKVLLQLQHGRLVPGVRPEALNPTLDFANSPFRPQTQAAAWRRAVVDGVEQPRRATVSSFGAGGSNVHLVLEEAPALPVPAPEAAIPRRFPFSALNRERLEALIEGVHDFVAANPDLSLARLSRTLREGRERLPCAVELIASDRDELLAGLADPQAWRPADTSPPLAADAERAGPVLALPGYPFARERHWLARAPEPAQPPALETPAVSGREAIQALVTRLLAEQLGRPPAAVDPDAGFREQGADSMFNMRLIHTLGEALGLALDHRSLERHPTPARLAQHLASREPDDSAPVPESRANPWPCPLSEGQKGLWILQRLYPDSYAYNVPLAFRVSGADRAALAAACGWLLGRFPLLAAVVEDAEPAPRMARRDQAPALVELEVTGDPLEAARARARRPFDLEAEAPVRFEWLSAPGQAEGVLLILVHHLVLDGVSAALLSAAFWDAYRRLAAGQAAPALPPQTEYADFVAWERAHLASPRGQVQKAYWLARLKDAPVLELPADRGPDPAGRIDGRSLERVLPATLAAAVRASAAALDISPAAFYLGVLQMLLYRYSGQDDLLVAVAALGRPASRFQDTVGYFANMLPIRARVSGGQSAAELLRQAQGLLSEGLDHGDYPFAALARELGQGGPAQPPYQVSFAYQNFLAEPATTGEGITHLPQLRQEGDGLFGLELFEEGGEVRVVAGYDGARFDARTMDRLLAHYAQLVAAVCGGPERPLASLDMLDAQERRRLARWSRGGGLPRRDGWVHQWIEAQARRSPEALALEADDRSLSYRQLLDEARRLAAHLRARGVRPGQPVAVLLARQAHSVAALLAVLSAGAVWVPLDPDQPDARLRLILADLEPAALLVDAATAPRVAGLKLPARVLDLAREAAEIAARPARPARVSLKPDSPAYVIYTSGSTGQPKGVRVSHGALAGHCLAMGRRLGLGSRDVVLQFASHTVDTALEQILPTLIEGGRLLLRGGDLWSPAEFARALDERGITVADLPPAYLRELLQAWAEEPERAPRRCPRLLIVGGEVLAADVVGLWQASALARARLLNAYGPTEATITSTVYEPGRRPPGTSIPIGRPLAGTRVYILDRDGNPVPEGVTGELYLGGPRLALGYHRRPELTAAAFVAPPPALGPRAGRLYRTGDLAAFGPGGQIAFRGRVDHQVKLRGFRIEPGEIEAALVAAGARAAAVLPRTGADGGQALVAFVVPAGAELDEQALRRALAARLPAHMLPALYLPVPALPLNAAGKLDRAALLALAPATAAPAAVAANPVEAGLARIWRELLGLEAEPGPDDDFFALGGHSLLLLRLLGRIQRAFGVELTVAELLGAPTIAGQARLLAQAESQAPRADSPLVLLRRGGEAPPLFLVHPVGGSVSCYLELARRLQTPRPVYGLRAAGPEGEGLEAMAARYVTALRELQPAGPYHLGGWSLGGVIAFEMARQLRAAGEAVALLALIESYTPALLARFDQDLLESLETRELDGVDPAEQARLAALFQAHRRALSEYRPGACDVPLTLLHATGVAVDKHRGWRDLARGGLRLHPVPGDHYSVLRQPQLGAWVAVLDAALAEAGAQTGAGVS